MNSRNTFKSSVNVKFDIGNEGFITQYLPTPSHAESIIGISDGFYTKDGNSAHIMIGPYGSGKSLVATILANFVSKSISDNLADELIKKYDKVHQEAFKSLKKLKVVNKKYVPVTLSGSEGVFSEAIIDSIVTSLEKANIELDLPGESSQILTIIEEWEQQYKNTFIQFQSFLRKRGFSEQSWFEKLHKGDFQEIQWFKNIYPNLTSGAEYKSNSGAFFLDKLEYILQVLKENNVGIFLIYDEFGRFLQNLDPQQIPKTMQDIQDLAELVNRSRQYMHVLLISHKSMSQYMFGFNSEFQSEFQRIEKRFASYFVESDPATYYRITEQFISEEISSISKYIVDPSSIVMSLRKYNLFEKLNQQEVDKIIVSGSYPIHPSTLYLLPHVSKVFGQNERTLFTYLQSNESGGLKNHLKKNGMNYYYPHHLFEFFFKGDTDDLINYDALHALKIFKGIEKKLAKNKKNIKLFDILKFITLWEITHSNSVYKIDEDLIAFSTGHSLNEVSLALEALRKQKFIRYNRILKVWELSEGSSIIVNELINDQLLYTKINQTRRISLLENMLPIKYFFASEYNDKKDMTRFMKVNIINSTLFINNETTENVLSNNNADGQVYMVVLDRKEDYKAITSKIKSIKHPFLIFTIVTESFDSIKSKIDRVIAIQELLKDKNTLSEYENLKEELIISKEELSYDIKNYLKKFFEFKSNVLWFYSGDNLVLSSKMELENFISNIMTKYFACTPIIRNDSVNRMNVKGIQKRSLLQVLDGVLKDYTKKNLGIEGQGPDYLIYATILKNNEINLNDLDGLKEKNFIKIRELLLNQLKNNPQSNLQHIKSILASSPFGIREPLIPLITVILLRDKWDQIIFQRNSMFVPSSEAEQVYEMFKEPNEYYYKYHDYSEEMLDLMNKIETEYHTFMSEYVSDKTPLIRVSSILLNWLRSLPRHTQITERMDSELLKLKELIRKSEVHPLTSFENLTNIYAQSFSVLKTHIKMMEDYHNEFYEKLKSEFNNLLGIESYDLRYEYLKSFTDNEIVKNRFLSNLKRSFSFGDFIFNFLGTELENWSDTNYDLFEKQIQTDINSINSQVEIDEDIIEITYNDKYKLIKKVDMSSKSEIIYSNLNRIIKNAGRNVPQEEISYLIFKLMEEYI